MNKSSESWSAFSSEIATSYLKTFGHPSPGSKQILIDVMRNGTKKAVPSVLDLGCGNGQLYEFFKSQGWQCEYTGVDFSFALLEVARRNSPEANFLQGDVNQLSNFIRRKFDFVIYSHVIEILESPEQSLNEAKKATDRVLIRFFEPPEFEVDTIELREMDLGLGKVPYLRRKMSRSYYRLILANAGCKRVDVYRDVSKDQVHALYF
jgi:ubiquinone/menaquinone biosynthesis C-methylase UbiE